MGGCDFFFVPLETSPISVIRNRTKSPQTRRLERVASRSCQQSTWFILERDEYNTSLVLDTPSLAIFIRRMSRMQIHHHLFGVSSDVEERV